MGLLRIHFSLPPSPQKKTYVAFKFHQNPFLLLVRFSERPPKKLIIFPAFLPREFEVLVAFPFSFGTTTSPSWRNPHRDISCMDTAYVRENPPPKIGGYKIWVVVWNIFYFHPYLGKRSNLTSAYFSDGLVKNHQLEIQYLHFGSWNFWETHVARKVVQLACHLHQLSSEPSISTTCHPSKSGSGRETQGEERKEKMGRQNMGAKLTWKMETLEEVFPFQEGIFRFHLSFQGCTWCFGLTFTVSEEEHFKDVGGFFLRFQCQ